MKYVLNPLTYIVYNFSFINNVLTFLTFGRYTDILLEGIGRRSHIVSIYFLFECQKMPFIKLKGKSSGNNERMYYIFIKHLMKSIITIICVVMNLNIEKSDYATCKHRNCFH